MPPPPAGSLRLRLRLRLTSLQLGLVLLAHPVQPCFDQALPADGEHDLADANDERVGTDQAEDDVDRGGSEAAGASCRLSYARAPG